MVGGERGWSGRLIWAKACSGGGSHPCGDLGESHAHQMEQWMEDPELGAGLVCLRDSKVVSEVVVEWMGGGEEWVKGRIRGKWATYWGLWKTLDFTLCGTISHWKMLSRRVTWSECSNRITQATVLRIEYRETKAGAEGPVENDWNNQEERYSDLDQGGTTSVGWKWLNLEYVLNVRPTGFADKLEVV